MKSLVAMRRQALLGGCMIHGVVVPDLFKVPDFLLATVGPDERAYLIQRSKALTEVNASGSSDLPTRQAWENVINPPKQGASHGGRERSRSEGDGPRGAALS